MRRGASIGHIVFIASYLITPAIVLSFESLRMRRERRSPLHWRQIDHVAGQQLLKRLDEGNKELSLVLTLMTVALPGLAMAWSTTQIDWNSVEFGASGLILPIQWAMFFTYGIWHYKHHLKMKEQARDSLLAERVTGMQLDQVIAHDCIAPHKLSCGDFSSDHVVVAPRGIFAIETRSFRQPPREVPLSRDNVIVDRHSFRCVCSDALGRGGNYFTCGDKPNQQSDRELIYYAPQCDTQSYHIFPIR